MVKVIQSHILLEGDKDISEKLIEVSQVGFIGISIIDDIGTFIETNILMLNFFRQGRSLSISVISSY